MSLTAVSTKHIFQVLFTAVLWATIVVAQQEDEKYNENQDTRSHPSFQKESSFDSNKQFSNKKSNDAYLADKPGPVESAKYDAHQSERLRTLQYQETAHSSRRGSSVDSDQRHSDDYNQKQQQQHHKNIEERNNDKKQVVSEVEDHENAARAGSSNVFNEGQQTPLGDLAIDEDHEKLKYTSSGQDPLNEHAQVRRSSEGLSDDNTKQDAAKIALDKKLDSYSQQQQQQSEQGQMHNVPEPLSQPPVKDEDEDNEESGTEEEHDVEEEVVMTPEQRKAEELFQAGEKLINATYYKEYREAYLNFLDASKFGHQKATEYVAFGHLFGDYLPQNVTKASELFEQLASVGSPKAQMGLAFMYSAGFHYNSSQAKALIYSTFGALGGDPLAQMALGYRYYAGIGVESTCETALTYYRKVATTVADSVTLAGGPVVQRVRLQEEAESSGTTNSPLLDDDLLQYYHFLADKGDQQAQVVLGTLYYQGGKGVQIDHEQAYHYFSTAAGSGSGHALGYLGKMHSEGSPVVKQSNTTAFEYFRKSSEKNNHIGQAGLGMMYLNGLGVDKDVTKAFRYFSLASDQGSVDGQLQLGIMYFSGNGVRADYKLAVKYFTMASQNGHVLAFYNLAQMHATGTGVLRNCHTAVELFKNVAERGKWAEMMMDAHRMYHAGQIDTALVKYMFLADLGYEVAQSNVAYLLDSGATIKFTQHETHQRALLQYSRAASQGSTHARLKMGDYHYYGLGTEVDYESAASHYRMASEQQHNAQAMFNLGYMHEKGLGLKQDVHLAKRFYDMAAETSMDAHVPVTLALLKLGLFYGVDVFSKEFEGISGLMNALDPMAYLGPQWDLYLAFVLSGLLVLLFVLRRRR